VLGAPIHRPSPAYVRTFVEGYEVRALSLLSRLRSFLVPTAGRVCHRDEFDMPSCASMCVWPRLRHFMRTLPPGDVTSVLERFQSSVLDAHLDAIPAATLASFIHIDPRCLCQLPGSHGGLAAMGCRVWVQRSIDSERSE